MLIHALCDYYDILARSGKVLPEGYSLVKIHYLICLTREGKIEDVIPCQDRTEIKTAKDKSKEIWTPKMVQMPQRTEKPGIEANIIEHRPLYLFGLNYDEGGLSPADRTDKAKRSHEAFVEANLRFTEGMGSPMVQAYRQFILGWDSKAETKNASLLRLGKNYGKSGFAFCLSGSPERLLQDEPEIKTRWEEEHQRSLISGDGSYISQCAICGEEAVMARVHSKIKGVYGGLATGSVLVGFNNASESSYGKQQSYNSNISERMMKKYTGSLNHLLAEQEHIIRLDDMTVVFWAMDAGRAHEDMIMAMLYGRSEKMDAQQTEGMLKRLLKDAKRGKIVEERLKSLDKIQPDVDFYMIGLKPNSSRLALKFIYRKRYADLLWNIAQFQQDLQISKEIHPISLARIKAESISPKSKNARADPSLIAKLFAAIIYGGRYPESLLAVMVHRVKSDTDSKVTEVRAGVIKACINRNHQKEGLGVALNKENTAPAYLCGRLFAVLEQLQQDASGGSLNRTIKDAYFASAASRPATVFPKLIVLAQSHLDKVKRISQDRSRKVRGIVFYNKLIGEIIDRMEDRFPGTLDLSEQGMFIVGYYQQNQSFFGKDENKQEEKEEERGYGDR